MEEKSKTQRKKESRSLQELGEKLVQLSAVQIEEIALPKELCDAILFAKTIKSHGARSRQLKYIGTMMRKHDIAPVQEAIHAIERGRDKKTVAFREIERWRDELIAGNTSRIDDIVEHCPFAERKQLTKLVQQAIKEREENKPPRAFRALFRYLRDIKSGYSEV